MLDTGDDERQRHSVEITQSTARPGGVLTASNSDTITFASGINYNQLWFNKSGNDLEISVIGQNEALTLTNWYSSSANHIGQAVSGDGYSITDTGIQAMVQAMASLTPPFSGQTTLPAATANAVASALAANWHHA